MHRQLLHLGALAERPNISLRVVQNSVGAYRGLQGPFAILEFAEEPALAHVENLNTGLFLEEEVDLSVYRIALNNILSVALKPHDSIDLIHQLTGEN